MMWLSRYYLCMLYTAIIGIIDKSCISYSQHLLQRLTYYLLMTRAPSESGRRETVRLHFTPIVGITLRKLQYACHGRAFFTTAPNGTHCRRTRAVLWIYCIHTIPGPSHPFVHYLAQNQSMNTTSLHTPPWTIRQLRIVVGLSRWRWHGKPVCPDGSGMWREKERAKRKVIVAKAGTVLCIPRTRGTV
jgi:hypothetical protein